MEEDRDQCDLLLVVGTSLAVAPVSQVMAWLPAEVPQILVNYEHVAPPKRDHAGFDVCLLGASDVVCSWLSRDAHPRPPRGRSRSRDRQSGDQGGSSSSGSVPRDIVAPAAETDRGAVFSTDGEFVARSMAVLRGVREDDGPADRGGETSYYVVVCDGCACEIARDAEVWGCRACWGYDLCGECVRGDAATAHSAMGESHVFNKI